MPGYLLGERSIRRIGDVVRRVEALPLGDGTGERRGARIQPISPFFWAEITGESTGGGDYSWKRQVHDGSGGLGDPGTATTGTETAQEAHGLKGIPTGTRVAMQLVGRNSSDQARYIFHAVGYGSPVFFKLSSPSGSAGTKTTPAAFTYTVSTLNDIQLGTGVDPTSAPHWHTRPTVGKLVAATMAIGYWQDNAGTPQFVIVRAYEEKSATGCS